MEESIVDGLVNNDVVSEKLKEILSGVMSDGVRQKLSDLMTDDVRKRLSGIIERYGQLSDDQKEEFKTEALGIFKENLHKIANNTSWTTQLWLHRSYIVFLFAALFVFFILVFFVYKLFKCLSEREARKEEKKKNKQLKKKK